MSKPIRKARAIAIAKTRENVEKTVFSTALLGMAASVLVVLVAKLVF